MSKDHESNQNITFMENFKSKNVKSVKKTITRFTFRPSYCLLLISIKILNDKK